MQPARGMGFPGPGGFGPPGGKAPDKANDKPTDTHKSGFGLEFPWVQADFTEDGKTYAGVGLRYKGNFTYISSANGLKRSMKIDLDRYDAAMHFHGLRKLSLNSGVTDPSKAREALSYAYFRAAGVPASRTAFAEVTLTVPGKHDKAHLGLYTLVEQVDKAFLKQHFGAGKGMLLKPEGLQGGLAHLGDDWKRYEERYRPKGEPTAAQKKRLVEFTRLINDADDAKFRTEIGTFLDVDAFLRYLAVNALLSNLDSFLGFGHNYYLYLRPDTNKFAFIPWDLDLSLGAWPVAGTPEQMLELSVMHPHSGQNKLIDRLLAMKDVNEKYRKLLAELTTKSFTKERLSKEMDAVEKVTKGPLARDAKAVAERKEGGGGGFGPFGGGVFGRSVPPRMFFEKRTVAVAAQLDGKSKGFIPQPFGMPGFGGPGGGQPQARPGEVLGAGVQQALRLSEAQKKRLAELQKEIDGKLDKLLTDDQRRQLKQMRDARPGGPGGGFPGGPGGGFPGGPPRP